MELSRQNRDVEQRAAAQNDGAAGSATGLSLSPPPLQFNGKGKKKQTSLDEESQSDDITSVSSFSDREKGTNQASLSLRVANPPPLQLSSRKKSPQSETEDEDYEQEYTNDGYEIPPTNPLNPRPVQLSKDQVLSPKAQHPKKTSREHTAQRTSPLQLKKTAKKSIIPDGNTDAMVIKKMEIKGLKGIFHIVGLGPVRVDIAKIQGKKWLPPGKYNLRYDHEKQSLSIKDQKGKDLSDYGLQVKPNKSSLYSMFGIWQLREQSKKGKSVPLTVHKALKNLHGEYTFFQNKLEGKLAIDSKKIMEHSNPIATFILDKGLEEILKTKAPISVREMRIAWRVEKLEGKDKKKVASTTKFYHTVSEKPSFQFLVGKPGTYTISATAQHQIFGGKKNLFKTFEVISASEKIDSIAENDKAKPFAKYHKKAKGSTKDDYGKIQHGMLSPDKKQSRADGAYVPGNVLTPGQIADKTQKGNEYFRSELDKLEALIKMLKQSKNPADKKILALALSSKQKLQKEHKRASAHLTAGRMRGLVNGYFASADKTKAPDSKLHLDYFVQALPITKDDPSKLGWSGFIYDYSGVKQGVNPEFQAQGGSQEAMRGELLKKIAENYPAGQISIEFQKFEQSTSPPYITPGYGMVKHQKKTSTALTEFFNSKIVNTVVDWGSFLLTLFPPTAWVGATIQIGFKAAKTAHEINADAESGTISAGTTALKIGSVAIDLLAHKLEKVTGPIEKQLGIAVSKGKVAVKFGKTGLEYAILTNDVYKKIQGLQEGKIKSLYTLINQMKALQGLLKACSNSTDAAVVKKKLDVLNKKLHTDKEAIQKIVGKVLQEAASNHAIDIIKGQVQKHISSGAGQIHESLKKRREAKKDADKDHETRKRASQNGQADGSTTKVNTGERKNGQVHFIPQSPVQQNPGKTASEHYHKKIDNHPDLEFAVLRDGNGNYAVVTGGTHSVGPPKTKFLRIMAQMGYHGKWQFISHYHPESDWRPSKADITGVRDAYLQNNKKKVTEIIDFRTTKGMGKTSVTFDGADIIIGVTDPSRSRSFTLKKNYVKWALEGYPDVVDWSGSTPSSTPSTPQSPIKPADTTVDKVPFGSTQNQTQSKGGLKRIKRTEIKIN